MAIKKASKDKRTRSLSSAKSKPGQSSANDEMVTEGVDPAPVQVIEDVEILPPEEEVLSADIEPEELLEGDAEEEPPATAPVSRSRDIVPYDPLSAYLREAGRHPPLSKEEEYGLALRYFTDKDREAGYKLVVSNLWLVVKIAREYEKAARNLLDLIQEGNIGLIEAVKNFDPYRGVRFPSYAVWWVRAYIIRHIIANWRMVKIGTTQAQRKLFFNLRKEKEKLEREGFVPAPKLLAEKLNVKEDEVVEMEQRLGSSEISVDAPLQDDAEQNLHGLLPSGAPSAEEQLGTRQLQELILKSFDAFAESLTEKERLIFRERMLGEEKATLQEISDKLSISRERVRQIENRLRERLKDFLSKSLGEDALGELKF